MISTITANIKDNNESNENDDSNDKKNKNKEDNHHEIKDNNDSIIKEKTPRKSASVVQRDQNFACNL